MKRRPILSRLFRVFVIALVLTLALGTLTFAAQAGYFIINKWFEGTWNTVIRSFNTDGNIYLSEEEIAAIEEVDVHDLELDSLDALWMLTSLRSLDCSENALTKLSFHIRNLPDIEGVYVVTSASLNVRKGPDESYPIVKALYKGDSVTVYSISNGYAKIIYDKSTCYVAAEYLVKVGDGDLPLSYLSCYGNFLEELDVTHLPNICDACINGTKDTSNPAYDKYESELGVLKVDKDVHIITTLTDYSVKWYDRDGSLLEEKFYWEGQDEPAADLTLGPWEDEHFYYEFSGWDEGTWVSATEKEYRPIYSSRVKSAVSGSFGTLGLTAAVYAPVGTQVVAVCCDAEGSLLEVKIQELYVQKDTTILFGWMEADTSCVFRLLLTDADWRPLCPSWTGRKES